jgi:hypothetical protein
VICFAAGEPLTEGVITLAGDILSFRVFGTLIVVLNSMKANKDLREGRSDVYSDRTPIPILEMYVFSS